MKVTRESILGLIGSGYHSCLLTSFSFDFHFFEVKVMRALRRANVRNIHLLLDAKYLDALLEFPSGDEMQSASAYSFTPIVSKGVFHPKIILLFGKKEGMVLIGSGNITSSGYGSNDEVWGAFHVRDPKSPEAELFAECWAYVNGFRKSMSGLHTQKLQWMEQFSPWVAELPKPTGNWISFGEEDIAFLSNSDKQSIWNQSNSLIGNKKIKEATIVSPYYDSGGVWLEELQKSHLSASINCVIDDEYGTYPNQMDSKLAKKINWFKWAKLEREKEPQSRLHAKLIQLNATDGTSYLLMGSANASVQALGANKSNAINDEACLLLRSKKIDYLKTLGIRLNTNSKCDFNKLPIVKKENTLTELSLKSKSTYILAAELDADELQILLSKEITKTCRLQLLSVEGKVFQEFKVKSFSIVNTFKVKDTGILHLVQIVDEQDKLLSNKIPITSVSLQIKSCPDPRQEKFEEALNAMENGEVDDFLDLLPFVELGWDDEDVNEVTKGNSRGGDSTDDKEIKQYTIEQIQKLTEERMQQQRAHFNSPSHKIADLLSLLAKGLNSGKKNGYADSEEQINLLDKNKSDEDKTTDEIITRHRSIDKCEKEKKSLRKFFNALLENYHERLFPLLELQTESQKKTPVILNPVESRHLSNYLIALHLLLRYQGKTFEKKIEEVNYTADPNGNAYLKEFALKLGKKPEELKEKFIVVPYLPITEDYEKANCITGFIYNIIGSFLLAIIPGFKYTDYDIINNRITRNRREAFVKTVFILANYNWYENEGYFDLLILNALHYLNPDSDFDEKWIERFISDLKPVITGTSNRAKEFTKNIEQFENILLPTYQKFIADLKDGKDKTAIKDLNSGDFLFTKNFGHCIFWDKRVVVKSVYDIDLLRPGFFLDEGEYVLRNYRTISSQFVVD